jgi:hypothetical protein
MKENVKEMKEDVEAMKQDLTALKLRVDNLSEVCKTLLYGLAIGITLTLSLSALLGYSSWLRCRKWKMLRCPPLRSP